MISRQSKIYCLPIALFLIPIFLSGNIALGELSNPGNICTRCVVQPSNIQWDIDVQESNKSKGNYMY